MFQGHGILVVDFQLDFLAYDFIRCACVITGRPTFSSAHWKIPPRWSSDNEEISLIHGKYAKVGNAYTLHLYSLPEAIFRDFPLENLDFPFELVGLVLIIDLSDRDFWNQDKEFFEEIRSTRFGGVGWVRNSTVRSVIVTIKKGPAFVSENEIFDLLGLNPQTPVFHHEDQTRIEVDKRNYNIIFSSEFTQNVLSAFFE